MYNSTKYLLDKLVFIANENNLWWKSPLINKGENEDILEWWNKDRKFTFYVEENNVLCLASWYSDATEKLEVAEYYPSSSNDESLLELWRWISYFWETQK